VITKSVICRGRVRTIEDAVGFWKADPRDAMEVRDIEDVIHECLWMRDFLDNWSRQARKALFANQIRNIQEEGKRLKDAFEMAIGVCSEVRSCVQRAESKDHSVDGSAALEAAVKEIESLRERLVDSWPELDKDRIEESLRAYERGECVPVEEVIRELQGAPPAGH
jgi:predicted transcriptional regulator